jgi:hypothetical protein
MFIAINAHYAKMERSQINNVSVSQGTRKEKMKPQI